MKKFSKQSELAAQFAAQLNSMNVLVAERIPGSKPGTMDVVLLQKQPIADGSKGIDYLYGKAAGAIRRMVAWGLPATHPLCSAALGTELPADLKLDYSYYGIESKRAMREGKLRTNPLPTRLDNGKALAYAADSQGRPVYRDTMLVGRAYTANKELVAGEISPEAFAQFAATHAPSAEVVGNRELLATA
jgi:hypothetical protein